MPPFKSINALESMARVAALSSKRSERSSHVAALSSNRSERSSQVSELYPSINTLKSAQDAEEHGVTCGEWLKRGTCEREGEERG